MCFLFILLIFSNETSLVEVNPKAIQFESGITINPKPVIDNATLREVVAIKKVINVLEILDITLEFLHFFDLRFSFLM